MLATQARLIEDKGDLLLTLLSAHGSSMCAKLTLDLADRLANELVEQARRMRSAPRGQVQDG